MWDGVGVGGSGGGGGGYWVCGHSVGAKAHLACRVRAITPAATEAEREEPGSGRVQPPWGARVTCAGTAGSQRGAAGAVVAGTNNKLAEALFFQSLV